MLDTLKVRLKPTENQKQYFERNSGANRWLYNQLLDLQIKYYEKNKKFLTYEELVNHLDRLESQYPWLIKCDSTSLQQTIVNLMQGFRNFFKSKSKRFGFPKFKSKKRNKASFIVTQENGSLRFIENVIRIPKIRLVKVWSGYKRLSSISNTKIRKFTISKDSDNNWYCSILVDRSVPRTKVLSSTGVTTGLDLGVSNTVTFPNGHIENLPAILKKLDLKICKRQKDLHRKVLGSKNREKSRLKLSKVYFRAKKIRENFNHELSHQIVKYCDVITVESLDIQKMQQTKRLAKLVSDPAWYQLKTFLKYKCERNNKVLIEVDKYFPSTKLCSKCGYENQNLTLRDRSWTCPVCNSNHNRDVNAAQNLDNISRHFLSTGEVVTTKEEYLSILK